MSRPQVSDLICQQLAANVAGLHYNTTGANLFTGKVRGVDQQGIPVAAVFVEQRDKKALPYLAAAQSGSRYPSDIIIRIRSAQQAPTAGKQLAEAIFDALHCKPPAGLVDCQCDSIDELGPDPMLSWEFVVHASTLWVGLP
jgi:hypothetical protein